MHDTSATAPPDTTAPTPVDRGLFAPGRAGASVGALVLISLLAFEALAVATSALGMVWAGPLCDRRGPWRATVLGLTFFTAGLLLAGGASSMAGVAAGLGPWAWLLPGWAAAGFSIGLGFPMQSVLTLQLAAPEAQGRAASALQLGTALAPRAFAPAR